MQANVCYSQLLLLLPIPAVTSFWACAIKSEASFIVSWFFQWLFYIRYHIDFCVPITTPFLTRGVAVLLHCTYFSGAVQNISGPDPSFFEVFRSLTIRYARPVELLQRVITSSQRPLPTQRTTMERDEVTCLQRDSNSRSQQSSILRHTSDDTDTRIVHYCRQ